MLPDAFPWLGLLALATAAFTDVMTDLLPAGLLPQMSGALHVPEARVGLLVSAFAIASAVAAIPVTAALRGLPRRPVLIAVLVGFAASDTLTAMSSWYLLTFLTRLAAGVMGGTLWSMLAGYAARMVPAGQRSGFGRTSLVLLVFGGATVAGIWLTGLLADRYLRAMLPGALGLIAVAMLVLGLAARQPAALLAAVALWGAAFGGAPTLLQTALVDASGPAAADVATAMQTTVYNVGIAAGSLAGGLVPDATALPWMTLLFTAAALSVVAVTRPGCSATHRP